MFGFPKIEREPGTHFKNNFLQSVVFQIKYSKRINFVNNKEKITSLLTSIFPNSQDIIENKVEIVPEKTQIVFSPKLESSIQGFSFSSKELNKKVDITSDTFTYTVAGNSYKSFQDFLTEINNTFLEIFKVCLIENYNRIAIRKINLLQFKLTEGVCASDGLNLIFNRVLVENLSNLPGKNYVNRGIFNLNFKNEEKNLVLNYGLLPTPQSPLNALLDIDLFYQGKEFNMSSLNNHLSEINDEIYNIFIWSLQEGPINSLNE